MGLNVPDYVVGPEAGLAGGDVAGFLAGIYLCKILHNFRFWISSWPSSPFRRLFLQRLPNLHPFTERSEAKLGLWNSFSWFHIRSLWFIVVHCGILSVDDAALSRRDKVSVIFSLLRE